MAIAIKSIPTLRGKVARDFVKKAEAAEKNRGTIDFTKQAKIAKAILDKANMK